MNRPYRLAITSGDADGIGFEIASKALYKVGPKKNWQFVLFRSPKASKRDLNRLDRSFRRQTVSSWHEVMTTPAASHRVLIDVCSSLSPARWVEVVAQAALLGHIDGIATAPISKTTIQEAGMSDIGHTDILKRVSGTSDVFMGFIGSKLNVVLATGHIPIKSVSAKLSLPIVEKAVLAGYRLRTLLEKKRQDLPLGLLGLNPHAGESGIIGKEEQEVHIPIIEKFKKRKPALVGPLIPDTSFFETSLKKYSVLIANYHDQGLIPFKSLHKDEANVHVTLGLPFIRTSVDHGTAKDIFGKNKADPNSMMKAIELAMVLSRDKSSLDFEKEL